MTPESSEQPRETREGLPLVERFDTLAAMQRDQLEQGLPPPPTASEVQRSKVSSPELASLAAKYVNIENLDKRDVESVRSLAASVLAQAEPKTNAGQ